MVELNFKTKVFEGPLDLMLTLISKHKLNIMDIEISILLEQFLAFMEEMQDANIELAGEFMEMAARLIYIKTAYLLPKHEVEELKKELEGLLIEYAMCKKVAEKLFSSYLGNDIFVRRPLDIPIDMTYKNFHDVYDLSDSLSGIFHKDKLKKQNNTVYKPAHPKSYVSVFTKIVYVLRRIQRDGKMYLNELFKGQKRSEQVAIFLALLELSKVGRINFSDDNTFLEFHRKKQDSHLE